VWCDFARFYLIGLGGRGQTSLAKFGMWKDVEDVCTAVVGRKDWAPGSDEAVERIFEGRKFKTQVLPRDKLVSVLHKHILDNYDEQIEMNYGYDVRPINFGEDGSDCVTVEVFKCQGESEKDFSCDTDSVMRISADLMIAADGTARTIANEMENNDKEKRKSMNPIKRLLSGGRFTVTRYEDDNQRVYKTVPMKLPPGWRPDLNYSARSEGSRATLDALPANRNGEYCGVLLVRKEDEMAQPDSDPAKLREYLDEYLPMFSKILDDEVVEQVAKKPPSFLPAFRYVGPRLNQGDHTLILGDCAHTVKPYFGLGANSALEDVAILSDAIDDTESMKDAVHEFSRRRAKNSMKMVRISRELDRPGTLGTLTFIVPIVLDSIFNKMAPKLFAPNIISMLQRHDRTFMQVARRKRMDRIAQLTIIGTGVTGLVATARFLVTCLAKSVGRKSSTVAAGIAASALGFSLLRKATQFFVPGMAPADVLSKTKTSISKNDSFSSKKE
jgi:2-polyprenyl-6-methoxyphenol hydroxylase-like FAD-dependent oxidoreductase